MSIIGRGLKFWVPVGIPDHSRLRAAKLNPPRESVRRSRVGIDCGAMDGN